MLDNVDLVLETVKPFRMIYLRSRLNGLIIFSLLLISLSCNKDIPLKPQGPSINNQKTDLVKDWTRLSLDLMSDCNGYNDLIASRAMYYLSITMYESLLPGLDGYTTLQARISGLNTTLPQPLPSKQYNWMIVTNQALALVSSELFKSSGNINLNKIATLRDKNIAIASDGLPQAIVGDSKDLGDQIGWKIIEYSNLDGRADSYLRGSTTVTMPVRDGAWIPTPPDYIDKPILPNWGESKPAYLENLTEVHLSNTLDYNTSTQSIMFDEATEVYNLTTNLSTEQREVIKYWNENLDSRATPLCHNMLIMIQMLEDKDFELDKAVELLLRMSIAQYDGYILSWKIKFQYDLLRPSSYIKQNISRYFIPEFSSTPVPEFASEKALIYNSCAEILSYYFGYRNSFIDYTQSKRTDLQTNKKYFDSFNSMAKEAAYSDLYSAVHFRTSIDVGFQMGYAISQKTLALKLTK